jgi:NarL family two-component system sensor histidine kinase YdfH
LQDIYASNQIEVVFETHGTFNTLTQSPTVLYNLYSLIDLFTTNSIRHARASRILVVLKQEPKQITLDMRDNGIGFDIREAEKNAKGRGLADFKGRAIILSPQYIFESTAGKGTHFRILIPLNLTQL